MLALRLLDVARKACIARVAKIFDHSNLKILIPKQMLQRQLIAVVQAAKSY